MVRFLVIIIFVLVSLEALAQTCTLSASGTVNWVNGNCLACDEGGDLCNDGTPDPVITTIIIPSDLTLIFDPGNSDTWTGTSIIVDGTMEIDAAPGNNTVQINSSITIRSGGTLQIDAKLALGTGGGCTYTIGVESGGRIITGPNAGDKLSICGNEIIRGGTSCQDFPAGPPYCPDEFPGGNFTCGTSPLPPCPITLTTSGLPVKLLYFKASIPKNEKRTHIEWATESEENFSHFEIERSGRDLKFSTLAKVNGAGYDTHTTNKYLVFDENPLVGIGYYRLKAVDIDGTYEYFSVKSVEFNGNKRMLVSPNPASGNGFRYTINFDPGPYDRVTLINQVGTELYSAPVTGTDNEFVPEVSLRPGAYLLRYTSPDFKEVARVFIKE